MVFSDANKARLGFLYKDGGVRERTQLIVSLILAQCNKVNYLYSSKYLNVANRSQLFSQIANMQYKLSVSYSSPILKSKTALYMSACDLFRRLLRIEHIPHSSNTQDHILDCLAY